MDTDTWRHTQTHTNTLRADTRSYSMMGGRRLNKFGFIVKSACGVGEMAPLIRVLAALAEEPSSVFSSHVAAHKQ